MRYEEFYDPVELTPGWLEVVGPTASMSRFQLASTAGASASFQFFGTGVSWVGQYGTNLGIADVFIDGELAATVDQYGAATQPRAVVFASEELPLGAHEIRVVPTGTKNPASTDTHTLLDGFDVHRVRDRDLDGVLDHVDVCPAQFDPSQIDTDLDGRGDACDNCTLQSNTLQFDFDGDGYGNACDADYDNNQTVGLIDWILFASRVFQFDPIIDLDEDLFVGLPDFFRFWQLWGSPPGPSAAHSP